MRKILIPTLFISVGFFLFTSQVVVGGNKTCCPTDTGCIPDNKKERKCSNERIGRLINCRSRQIASLESKSTASRLRAECDAKADRRYRECLNE